MADRLRAMGKPIDVLYFPTAPHSTKQPRHRWRSLTMHVDWWRFWLQGYEDPDPTKAAQYRRWRSFGAW
jgi:dipeptidyl aminopeptidase/acylaminoacyl peptidase